MNHEEKSVELSYSEKADQLAIAADLCEDKGMLVAAEELRVQEKKWRLTAEVEQREIIRSQCGTKENPHIDDSGFMYGFCKKCGECLG